MKIRVIKNKIAAPYKEAQIGLVYGEGIDKADELFQIALKAGLIRQGGAWFTYVNEDGEIIRFRDQDMKFQGRDNMIEAIRTIPEFFGELEDIIRGVKVEADEMDEAEVEAMKMAEAAAEAASTKAATKAYEKNKQALEKRLAEEG